MHAYDDIKAANSAAVQLASSYTLLLNNVRTASTLLETRECNYLITEISDPIEESILFAFKNVNFT